MRIKSRTGLSLTNKQIDKLCETELAMYILMFNDRLNEKKSNRLYEISGLRIMKVSI